MQWNAINPLSDSRSASELGKGWNFRGQFSHATLIGFNDHSDNSPNAAQRGIQLPDARYSPQDRSVVPGQRIRELAVFLLLALAIWPILSIAFVGAYGFLIWFYQMFAGPPGPPPIGH